MHAAEGGIPACPDDDRPRRLAAQLADMIPGAATVRVSLNQPYTTWPSPYATVRDAQGEPVEVSRSTARIAARWVLRTWPDADWSLPHTLDLATATLAPGSTHAGEREN
jgi:hypothetical protein